MQQEKSAVGPHKNKGSPDVVDEELEIFKFTSIYLYFLGFGSAQRETETSC